MDIESYTPPVIPSISSEASLFRYNPKEFLIVCERFFKVSVARSIASYFKADFIIFRNDIFLMKYLLLSICASFSISFSSSHSFCFLASIPLAYAAFFARRFSISALKASHFAILGFHFVKNSQLWTECLVGTVDIFFSYRIKWTYSCHYCNKIYFKLGQMPVVLIMNRIDITCKNQRCKTYNYKKGPLQTDNLYLWRL